MKRFEVGKTYKSMDMWSDFEITVTKRTDKTIWVERDGCCSWMMRIKKDRDGNEYAVDSTFGKKYRDEATFKATYEMLKERRS